MVDEKSNDDETVYKLVGFDIDGNIIETGAEQSCVACTYKDSYYVQ